MDWFDYGFKLLVFCLLKMTNFIQKKIMTVINFFLLLNSILIRYIYVSAGLESMLETWIHTHSPTTNHMMHKESISYKICKISLIKSYECMKATGIILHTVPFALKTETKLYKSSKRQQKREGNDSYYCNISLALLIVLIQTNNNQSKSQRFKTER